MKYKWLWLLVILFAAGDVVTTIHGLSNGEDEGNPVVVEAIDYVGALPALVSIKLWSLLVGLAAQSILTEYEWIPATILLLVWGPVVAWNLVVLT